MDASRFTPASCPGVITVASNGITGKRAFYSNFGQSVTLSAPGGGIYQNDASSGQLAKEQGFVWSTINAGLTVPTKPEYGGLAGTSQAAPHVAGTVAMMLGAAKAADMKPPTPDQIKSLLIESARPFPSTPDQPIGAGIVDAYKAIQTTKQGRPGNGEEPSRSFVKEQAKA